MLRRVLPLLLLMSLPVQAALTPWDSSALPARAAVIDTRPLADCTAGSLANARCLPAREFVDSRGQLAPWREILWLFSTARLTGGETVLVVGERDEELLLVAALLHLAGQKQVYVARRPVNVLAARLPAAPGTPRDFARQVAYTARFREALLVFPHEFDKRKQARVSDVSAPMPKHKQPVVSMPDPIDAVIRWARWLLAGRTVALLELPGRT